MFKLWRKNKIAYSLPKMRPLPREIGNHQKEGKRKSLMKRVSDPRHLKRRKIIQELFASSFIGSSQKKKLTQAIWVNIDKIDKLISKAAPQFPIEKIVKSDLAILRLAIYELTIDKKEPLKVIIDEAIELAKEFSGETSPAFVNGVLGTVVKKTVKNYTSPVS